MTKMAGSGFWGNHYDLTAVEERLFPKLTGVLTLLFRMACESPLVPSTEVFAKAFDEVALVLAPHAASLSIGT